MNEHFFIYNNEFFRAGVPVITVENRSFRYGEGLFETMRFRHGRIINLDLHFERLAEGMKVLGLGFPNFFSKNYFIDTVNELLLKNSISENARIRLMMFAGDEALFRDTNQPANFIIETFPLSSEMQLNKEGLAIDIFAGSRKSTDDFSNIKSNNYLPSVMAAKFALRNKLDDVVILNSFGRICESSIANVFIVKSEKIITPPLSEGCVAGVMRRFLLEKLSLQQYTLDENSLTTEDILAADEVFLTNSIQLLKWVKKFRNKTYGNEKVKEIFHFLLNQIEF